MKKTMVLNETETVKMMIREVSKTVKAYESDFYKYDLQTFYNMENGDKRILFLRETGTYFPLSTDTYMINALMGSGMEHKKYYMIEKLTNKQKEALELTRYAINDFDNYYMITRLTRSEVKKMC